MDFTFSSKEKGNEARAANKFARNARRNRQKRKKEKEIMISAIRLQARFRGNRTRREIKSSFRESYDKKTRDLSTLITMLKSKGVDFEPPAQLLVGIAKLLVFFFEDSIEEDATKRLNFLVALFIRSVHSTTTQNNVMCCYEENKNRFWRSILRLCIQNLLRVKICAQLCISVSSTKEIGVEKNETSRSLSVENLKFLMTNDVLSIIRSSMLKHVETNFMNLERAHSLMMNDDESSTKRGLSKLLYHIHFSSMNPNLSLLMCHILTIPAASTLLTKALCSKILSSKFLLRKTSLERLTKVPSSSKYALPIEQNGSAAYLLGNLVHIFMRSSRRRNVNDTYLVLLHTLACSLPRNVFSRGGAHVVVKQATTTKSVKLSKTLTRQLQLISSDVHVKGIVRSALSHYEVRANKLIKQDLERQGEISSDRAVQGTSFSAKSNWLSNASKWARNLFSSKKKKKRNSVLKNVSSQSRKIAIEGKDSTKEQEELIVITKRDISEDHKIIRAMCDLCLLMIHRGDDVESSYDHVKGHVMLSQLAFSTPIVRHLWAYMIEIDVVKRFQKDLKNLSPCVELFCRLVSHELLVVDDFEWMKKGTPLPVRTFST